MTLFNKNYRDAHLKINQIYGLLSGDIDLENLFGENIHEVYVYDEAIFKISSDLDEIIYGYVYFEGTFTFQLKWIFRSKWPEMWSFHVKIFKLAICADDRVPLIQRSRRQSK